MKDDPKPWTKKIYEETARVFETAKQGKILAKGKEAKWQAHAQAEEMGTRIKYLVTPKHGFDSDIAMFIEEVAPGGHNNKHRHYLHAIKYVLSGKGHEEIDGKKYYFEEGDAINIPSGAWHQTFNDDKNQPLRFLAAAGYLRFPILDDLMDEGL